MKTLFPMGDSFFNSDFSGIDHFRFGISHAL